MSDVFVYIYDLTHGLARHFSASLIGKEIDGVWHTGIVVYNEEIYYGSNGISKCPPEGTVLKAPQQKFYSGRTEKSKDEINSYITRLSENIFHGSNYDLFFHNCNTFSNELSHWLVGKGIPNYIIDLPQEVLDTPLGKMLQANSCLVSPVVSNIYESAATYYNSKYNDEVKEFSPILYKENFVFKSDLETLKEEIGLEKYNQLETLIYKDDIISDSIVDLLKVTDNDNVQKVVYSAMGIGVIKREQLFVILACKHYDWLSEVLKPSGTSEIHEIKYKFIANFFGLLQNQKEISNCIQLSQYLHMLIEDVRPETLEVISSVIWNILILKKEIDEDTLVEVGGYLIHELSENQSMLIQTKENVVGSIYLLVKYSTLMKEIALAYDLHKRNRRETIYCLLLHKELQ